MTRAMREPVDPENLQWTSPRVTEVFRDFERDFGEALAGVGPELAVQQFLENAARLGEAGGSLADLQRFACLVLVLEADRRTGVLKQHEARRLLKDARGILEARGIQPARSAVGFLHRRLDDIEVEAESAAGELLRALWIDERGVAAAPVGDPAELARRLIGRARILARRGQPAAALDCLRELRAALDGREAGAAPAVDPAEPLDLLEARYARFSGDLRRAMALVDAAAAKAGAAGMPACDWERLCCQTLQTLDPTAMVNAVGRRGDLRGARQAIAVNLWCRALPSTEWIERCPGASGIAQTYAAELAGDPGAREMLRFLRVIERYEDTKAPIAGRIEALGEAVCGAATLPALDLRLLFLLAATRLLVRSKQAGHAAIPFGEYQQLSRVVTEGQRDDVLGLAADLALTPWASVLDAAAPAALAVAGTGTGAARLPTGIARVSHLALLALGLSAGKVKFGVKRASSRREAADQLKALEAEEMAGQLARVAYRLKGPVAKFIQLLAYTHPGATPRMRAALVRSQDANLAIPFADVRKVIERQLGVNARQVLDTIDPEPIGVGSVAQVHRFSLPDGRPAVIKVRYPGITEVMRSDLHLARLAIPFMNQTFPMADFRAILDASAELFVRECDLAAEARHQTRFRELFADSRDMVIPEVYPHLSGEELLAMEWIEGVRFNSFVAGATVAEKDRIGRIIYEFAFTSFFRHAYINADPHPGNYLITPGGRVAFLDFGYSQDYPVERLRHWLELARGGIARSPDAIDGAMRALGFVSDPERFDYAYIRGMADMILKPVTEAGYRFSPEFAAGVLTASAAGNKARAAMSLPVEDIMLARFFWTLQVVLGELNAGGDFAAIFMPLVGDGARAA